MLVAAIGPDTRHVTELAGAVSVPEAGQLVQVRQRRWVVAEVQASTQGTGLTARQHSVSLNSVDEDSLGEQLEVIWEIEPGAHVIERAGLPEITGQDDTEKLEAFLDAVRWGAATNIDRNFLQAPFRSGISIEDFQLDPVVRAIDMARANLLIADDVGLGKTIEAGLVMQELLIRHRIRTILVLCPASLQEKWRTEMLEKFGLEFRIINASYIKLLRRSQGIHANPWTSFPRLITSVDWLKSGDPLRMFRQVLPPRNSYPRKFDMLVVDEAHNVAPTGTARYVLESQRTRLVRLISPHFQHRLFLTATPHNGYTHSFTSLLELMDDQRFSRNVLPDPSQLSQVMVRRLKTDLVNQSGEPLYPKRRLRALSISFSSKERDIHKKLNAYCRSRMQTCRKDGITGIKFINVLLKKRLFSSPAAFASTLERHYSTLTTSPIPRLHDSMDDQILRKAILRAEEEYANDAEAEDAQCEAVEEVTRRAVPLTDQERTLLAELREWAQSAQHQVDSKAGAVVAWIENNLRPNGEWNNRRVVLFTEYRATLNWLQTILASRGLGGERLGIIHGGIEQEEREAIKAAFQTNPSDAAIRILLATDAASEGIDLQLFCNVLKHIEIPYNPNVMEQRNGRIDRHGQKSNEVLIWHPVDGDYSSESIGGHKNDIIRALNKLESMRADMGSVNPVIAPQMAELIEGTRRDFDTHLSEVRSKHARRYIRSERDLQDRIARLHDRLQRTMEEFHLTPSRVYQAVKVGLSLAGKLPLTPAKLEGIPENVAFAMPPLTGTWAKCMEGLRHPHTNVPRPITFDHQIAKNREDVVLVHLNHRLTQMCLRLMRAEVWATNDVKKLHRVDIRTVPDSILKDLVVVVISRLVITGGTHRLLHEELTESAGYLRTDGYTRERRVKTIGNWLNTAVTYKAEEKLLSEIVSRYESQGEAIFDTARARSRERLRNLENTLAERERKEVDTITSVLGELQRTIEDELKAGPKREQLELFDDVERTQLQRDVEYLKARLAEIPDECEQEVESIRDRYGQPQPFTFPVAVVFLVPESLLGGINHVGR